MRFPSPDRVGFVLSLTMLAFLYGFGARHFGWFPSSLLELGIRQGHRIVAPPAFTRPRVYESVGVRTVDGERMQPGLTLVAKNWESFDWGHGIKLLDEQGRVAHAWRVDLARLFPDSELSAAGRFERPVAEHPLHGTYLFRNGDVLVNIDYVGAARLDACGRVLWRLPAGNHHSIERAIDGSFWIPAASAAPRRATPGHPDGLPGLDQPVYLDRIANVSEEGELLREFTVLDILYRNGLERHILKARRRGLEDITHLNDVEPLTPGMADEYPMFEAGDLLVSLRNLDLLIVFDPETESVKWHRSHEFIYQHDPDFLGGGWIGIFDNNMDGTPRGTMLGGSRILAIQPHTDSTRVLFPGKESDPFYTDVMGKWQVLENGNLLLTESRAGRIVEVDPDGRTVWEWIAEGYGEDRTAVVTEGARYDLSRTEVAAWPCSRGDTTALREERTP